MAKGETLIHMVTKLGGRFCLVMMANIIPLLLVKLRYVDVIVFSMIRQGLCLGTFTKYTQE